MIIDSICLFWYKYIIYRLNKKVNIINTPAECTLASFLKYNIIGTWYTKRTELKKAENKWLFSAFFSLVVN